MISGSRPTNRELRVAPAKCLGLGPSIAQQTCSSSEAADGLSDFFGFRLRWSITNPSRALGQLEPDPSISVPESGHESGEGNKNP